MIWISESGTGIVMPRKVPVAAAVARPRRQQFGRQKDQPENQEEQGGHRGDDQNLAELRYGDHEHDVEPFGAAEPTDAWRVGHRLERCAGQSLRWLSAGSSASMIGLTRSAVTETTNAAAIAVRKSSASHNRGRDTVAAISHTGS